MREELPSMYGEMNEELALIDGETAGELPQPMQRDFSYDAGLTTDPPPDAVDFVDAAFFAPDELGIRRKLPEPTEIIPDIRTSGVSSFELFKDHGIFVKYGQKHRVSIEEVMTMRALRRAFSHDELPIPEVIAWRRVGIINVIYMSIVPGETLQDAWPTLDFDEKTNICMQLGWMLVRLRTMRQEPDNVFVGSVNRTRARDNYFTSAPEDTADSTVREFNDRVEFHSLSWLPMDQRGPDEYRHLLPDDATICFTHADLHPTNIMVAGPVGSRSVTSVIDWGSSGWYPEYWEYVKAYHRNGDELLGQEGWLDTILVTQYDPQSFAYANYHHRLGVP